MLYLTKDMRSIIMNDTQFHQLADQLILALEEQLDNVDEDIDIEVYGNVAELIFPNNTRVVINRQEPLHQIWLATKENGYHFEYKGNQWICNRSGRTFDDIISAAIAKQSKS